MKSGRYAEGARNRQNILDYLNDHPGTMAPDIIRALGLDKVVGSDRLGTMYQRGELDREKATFCGINSAGKRFCMGTFAYTAAVKTTMGANEMLIRVAENLREPDPKPKKPTTPAWLTSNTDPYRKPIRNQGGQGNIRRELGVQSGLAL